MHGCLVLDIRMPGMSGLELQEYLAVARLSIPVIIVTGHGDVPVTVRAMKKGAFDFLQKPFNDQALLDSIFAAIRKHEEICAENERRAEEEQNLASLTSREREVLELLRAGKSSKVIAADLDISVRTVEGHRANIMLKMNAKTVGQLIGLASKRDSAPG
jgi:FixJ family two-component response regulator